MQKSLNVRLCCQLNSLENTVTPLQHPGDAATAWAAGFWGSWAMRVRSRCTRGESSPIHSHSFFRVGFSFVQASTIILPGTAGFVPYVLAFAELAAVFHPWRFRSNGQIPSQYERKFVKNYCTVNENRPLSRLPVSGRVWCRCWGVWAGMRSLELLSKQSPEAGQLCSGFWCCRGGSPASPAHQAACLLGLHGSN